ncbi:hypothetical protein VNI00_005238 [Paramarasmius palmivorus]|uniref:ABC transporter TMD0 domain-containing protein n=1 Tax=Paramarasmius palmivorus TaxID=297713 RepID=A0AAW0DGF9_9AGAR
MPLCANRVPLPGSPSTCTLDTVIVPLPSFLLVAAFLLLYLRLLKAKPSPGATSYPKWLHYVYFILVIAALGMALLEIGRLVVDDLGVGLLPITPVAFFLVLYILWHERRVRTRAMSYLLSGYWLFLCIVFIVKTVRLRVLEQHESAKSKYPASDQLLDNAVMAGLFAVFFCAEIISIMLSKSVTPEPFELGGVR